MDKKEFEKKIEDNTNEILEDTLLDEEAPFQDTRAIKYEDIIQNTTKEKISKLPWIAAIFLIVVISITFGYMFLNSNPQTIFTMTVDNFFKNISKNINDESYDISKGHVKADVSISGNEILEDMGTINIDATYSIDKTNGLSKVKFKSKNDKENLIDMDIYNDGKNTYIYSKDIYEKYIKLDNNYKTFSQKDIKIILNNLNQAIDKVATSEKINGRKTNYDTGTSSIDVYESKLIIDSKNYERVSLAFINTLKSDDEFIYSVSNISNMKNNEVKEKLDEFLTNLKEFLKENEKVEIILYTDRKTNNFIKGEIKGSKFYISYVQDTSKFTINYNEKKIEGNIDIKNKKDKYSFNLNCEIDDNGVKKQNHINMTITNKKAANFGKVNVDEAKDINEMSDIEKFTIYTKMYTNPALNKFLKNVA